MKTRFLAAAACTLAATLFLQPARADVVTDWNARAVEILADARLGTPPAVRAMAMVQTAVHEVVSSAAAGGASVDAAVAAANRAVLLKLVPSQQTAIDKAYQAAIAAIAEGGARSAGIALGEQAAAAVLARRADDVVAAESYRPFAAPGAYVPTAFPAAPQWGLRRPWLMASAAEMRPGPPPALQGHAWSRDFNEVQALGARNSHRRTAEQTEIARFWEYSAPSIYMGVVRSVAEQPDRDVARNARLYMAVAQAMDDALIGVFDAKYHYNFWRPVTAIRNGDIDGNPATVRDGSWAALVDAPMHPEYPSGHGILAGAVGAVLQADLGSSSAAIRTASPTARGATRSWSSIDAFVREVQDARVYAGIHYRFAVEEGAAMGARIGGLAARRYLGAGTVTAAR
jgi:hypothetical protein